MRKQVPIAEGLFTWPSDSPHLNGSECLDCRTVTFPARASCPACCSQNVSNVLLPRRGTLWTWTIQGFLPKSPPYLTMSPDGIFEPYGVGYVELGQTTRVEGRLTVADPNRLRIGMEMELVMMPLMVDASGNEIITYGFEPVVLQSPDGGLAS